MRLSKSLAFASMALLLFATRGFAQNAQPSDTSERGYVSVAAGAITNSPVQAVFFGEYAENVGRHAQAYVNLSYMDNMIPTTTRDAIDAAAVRYGALLGSTATFTSRDRGVSVTGGGKYIANSRGAVQPYIGGGAGVVSIKRTITDNRLGDVTQAVLTDFGAGTISLAGPDSATQPIGEIVGGVGFVSSHTIVDVGYKYRRVFGLDQYDFSQLTAGIGYKW